MDVKRLGEIYDSNKDRINLAKTYLARYEVSDDSHVSDAIRGYTDARKNDLVLIPNAFESEIVDNIANWAFARGFTLNTENESDQEKISDLLRVSDLKVLAKNLGKYVLATGKNILTAYADGENRVNFFVPEPQLMAYTQDVFGNIQEFVFYYWRQEEKGYRLYADAFDSKERTTFKAKMVSSNQSYVSATDMEIIETKPHFFKQTPAVLLDMKYPAFYKVIALIDAYNKLLTETNDQFSAFKAVILALKNLIMTDDLNEKVYGTGIEGRTPEDGATETEQITAAETAAKQAYDKIMKMSVYLLGEDGDANFLKREVQVEAFTEIEKVIRVNINRFAGNINYADPEVLGKATNLAINTRTKPIDNKAKDLTDLFQMKFKNLLRICNNFWKIKGLGIDVEALSFEFNYDKPTNAPEEATTVQALINSGTPKKYAYQQFSGFTDPERVAEEAEEEEKANSNSGDVYDPTD